MEEYREGKTGRITSTAEEEKGRNEDKVKNKIRMIRREIGDEEDRQKSLMLRRTEKTKKMVEDDRGDNKDGEGEGIKEEGEKRRRRGKIRKRRSVGRGVGRKKAVTQDFFTSSLFVLLSEKNHSTKC